MYNLSICAIFKNEVPYLPEWIEYHRLQGVDHFYLANNAIDPKPSLLVLQPYLWSGLVTLTHFPIKEAPQLQFYNSTLNLHRRDTKWMAFIDIDEFIVPDKSNNLLDILKDFESDPRCGALALYWACFASSGRQTRPFMQTDTYRWRPRDDDPGHDMVKSIVRTERAIQTYTPHAAHMLGGYVTMNTKHEQVVSDMDGKVRNVAPTYHRAKIHHYLTRSKTEWQEKMERGLAHGLMESPAWRWKIWDMMEATKHIYDDSAVRFVPKVKERLLGNQMKTFNEIPGYMNFEPVYLWAVRDLQGSDQRRFVEVGTWLGRSAIFMAETIKRKSAYIDFYAIDHFVGASTPEQQMKSEYMQHFQPVIDANGGTVAGLCAKHILECGVQDYVTQIVASSEQAVKLFADDSLDFVFIDAGHDYQSVKKDIEVWLPKVKKNGGVLAGHDYDHYFPEIVKAVNDYFNKKDYELRFIQDNVWGVQRSIDGKPSFNVPVTNVVSL